MSELVYTDEAGERPEAFVPWSVASSVSPLDSALRPVLTRKDFHRLMKDPEWQQMEIAKCQRDPWYWRVNYVVTTDGHWAAKGRAGQFERWPALEHSRSYTYVLWRYPIVAIPKSRQRMATWLVTSQMLGDAMFLGGRLYMIQSKRHEDAKKALDRVRGVYEQMYKMAPWLVPKLVKNDASELGWSNGSVMMAVPQGANYVQSHTPAWWMADEIQLQEGAEEAFRHAAPACERMTLVGTADYGWFYQDLLRGGVVQ